MTTHRAASVTARNGERGSIALYFAIITVAALAIAGLVIDGGAALSARERAADLATQAARAGANALAPATLRGTPQALAADPATATAAARRVLRAAGATGQVRIDGDRVTVTARVPRHAVILSAVGLRDISQSATATATVVFGGATRDGGG